MKNLIAGLEILAKYNADADMCAEHDIIVFNIQKDDVSQEDQDKLDSLCGWHWSDEFDGWGYFT